MTGKPWTVTPEGLSVTVRLTPKGGRDALDGMATRADGRPVLKARVRAAASEGEANAALVGLLAKALGVPARAVALVAGQSARIKRLTVTGDAPTLAAKLDAICGGKP